MESKPKHRGRRPVPLGPDGLTPRQLVDFRRAILLQIQIAKERGELVQKSAVDAGLKEAAEVIQSDLFGVLVSRCATELSSRKLAPEKVKVIVTRIVHDIVSAWAQAEIVPQEALGNDQRENEIQPIQRADAYRAAGDKRDGGVV